MNIGKGKSGEEDGLDRGAGEGMAAKDILQLSPLKV